MPDAAKWRQQGMRYRELARTARDGWVRDELLKLAVHCDEMAAAAERMDSPAERAPEKKNNKQG
jgi:hypothetical protein